MRKNPTIGCYGEILLRASTLTGAPLAQSNKLMINIGGAEANVAAALSGFGRDVRFIGALPDNALGTLARQTMMSYGVNIDAVAQADGRMGLYFLETGAGRKPAQILYDRAGSVFAQTVLPIDAWQSALKGLSLLHISGVTPAVSKICAENVATACEVAAEAGVAVSYDFNHRAKLWAAWQGDAMPFLKRILSQATIVFANDHDLTTILESAPPSTDPRALELAPLAFAALPQLELLATAARDVHTSDHHSLTAHLARRDDTYVSNTLDLQNIVDRIGGGDAFAAGILDAYFDAKALPDMASIALGAAAYKHYVSGDAIHISRQEALHLSRAGRADVQR